MSIVGDNIRRIRTSQRRSQDSVGRAIGHAGGRYICAIEQGQRHPSPDMLARIADELGVQPQDLKKQPLPGSIIRGKYFP